MLGASFNGLFASHQLESLVYIWYISLPHEPRGAIGGAIDGFRFANRAMDSEL